MRPTDPGSRTRQLLCRDEDTSAVATVPSFRVYYSLAPRTVPFLWESQPGTPKEEAIPEEPAIPPLTPPPSYHSKPRLCTEGRSKGHVSRECLLDTILRRGFFSSRKDDQDGRRSHDVVSPAHSGLLSLSSSSTSSSSTSSSSVSPAARPTFFFEGERGAGSKPKQAPRSLGICVPVGSPRRTTTAAGRWCKGLFSKKLGLEVKLDL